MNRQFLFVLMAMLATGHAAPFSAQGQEAQTVTAVRAAAARFALANGIDLPVGDVAVAVEMGFKLTDVAPPKMSAVELQSQAAAISTAIGRGAQPGSAEQLLSCRRSACAPATKTAVLLIDQPTRRGPMAMSVYVRLYEPTKNAAEYDALLSHGSVEVEQKDGVWTGVRFRLGPSQVKVKLPSH